MNIFLTFILLGISVPITETTDPGMQMRLTDHAMNYGKFKTFLHVTVILLCLICIAQAICLLSTLQRFGKNKAIRSTLKRDKLKTRKNVKDDTKTQSF